jgi:hypothetical protein
MKYTFAAALRVQSASAKSHTLFSKAKAAEDDKQVAK